MTEGYVDRDSTMNTETTTEGMYEKLRGLLSTTVPDFELRIKAELAVEINRLKEEKNAVILGHNYMFQMSR